MKYLELEQKIPYREYFDAGNTWENTKQKMNEELGTNYTKNQVRDMLKRVRPKEGPTLVFGDTHIPYHREGYLNFLRSVYYKYGCVDVICVGDLVDHHAISRHNSEPDAVGDVTEFEACLYEIEKLMSVFPKMVITLGNHDLIPQRQAKTLGISSRYLKSFSQLWNLPSTVTVVEEYECDGVIYQHGMGSAGKDGAINTAIKLQSSFVQGHTHAFAGVKWAASPTSLIFGLNTGCLCDPKSLAMAYAKTPVNRPVLGCGVIHDRHRAEFVPFVL